MSGRQHAAPSPIHIDMKVFWAVLFALLAFTAIISGGYYAWSSANRYKVAQNTQVNPSEDHAQDGITVPEKAGEEALRLYVKRLSKEQLWTLFDVDVSKCTPRAIPFWESDPYKNVNENSIEYKAAAKAYFGGTLVVIRFEEKSRGYVGWYRELLLQKENDKWINPFAPNVVPGR
ncbi:MAG: hypothetical protein M1355_03000 [Patescibacteria group bacterium]|nr:hypothetical protein [Patescibacteria group bacterium]